MDQNQRENSRAVELIERLGELGHPCALVGGLAVSIRTRPRLTRDVDVAVAVDVDKQAERVAFELSKAGYSLREMFESRITGYVSTLRFNHPLDPSDAEEPTIDLLFSSSGIEKELVHSATPVRSRSGTSVRVARLPYLVALKVLSESEDRPNDRDDLKALIRVASADELREAAELVVLIEERGYHRDRELQPRLASFIKQYRTRGRSM